MARRPPKQVKNGIVNKKTKVASIITQMQTLYSLNPYLYPVESIVKQLGHLDTKQKQHLLSLCEKSLSRVDFRKLESVRVAIAKILVVLVPDSLDTIKQWINMKRGKYVYEVHFSLFCFLGHIPELPNGKGVAGQILPLVEYYLLQVASETAYAAWMAGDLLGDHWTLKEAIPLLVKAAKEAKFVAGRKGALHGLAHVLNNLEESHSPDFIDAKNKITILLQQISENDRSQEIRKDAQRILENGC